MSDRLRGDLIAGLTVWAVLVPEALAYAAIAGVSPVVGLYAAPGARTQLSGVVVAAMTVVTLLLLGVLVFDTLPGLFIGIAISLLLLLYRVSRPRIARDVGLVRDLLRTADDDDPSLSHVYPSVQAAVDAASDGH